MAQSCMLFFWLVGTCLLPRSWAEQSTRAVEPTVSSTWHSFFLQIWLPFKQRHGKQQPKVQFMCQQLPAALTSLPVQCLQRHRPPTCLWHHPQLSTWTSASLLILAVMLLLHIRLIGIRVRGGICLTIADRTTCCCLCSHSKLRSSEHRSSRAGLRKPRPEN